MGEIIRMRKMDTAPIKASSLEEIEQVKIGCWKVWNRTLPANSDIEELSTFSNESVWTFEEQVGEKLEVEMEFLENVDLHEDDDEE